jgi:hypothetical protein
VPDAHTFVSLLWTLPPQLEARMSDQGKTSWAGGVAHAFAAFAGTPFPYLLGVALMLAAVHWDGHLQSQKGCVQLQEVQGRVFKVNTCTGATEEIKLDKQSNISGAATHPGVATLK